MLSTIKGGHVSVVEWLACRDAVVKMPVIPRSKITEKRRLRLRLDTAGHGFVSVMELLVGIVSSRIVGNRLGSQIVGRDGRMGHLTTHSMDVCDSR